MGPTASGKTKLAIKLSRVLPVELISVDSALVYKTMNIGTAKPTAEELRATPHLLLDIIDPAQTYSAANFCHDALTEMTRITAMGRIPLLVGGTMLYYKALLEGLSPLPPANQEIRMNINKQAIKYGWNKLHENLSLIDPLAALRIHQNDSRRISRALEVFFISGKTLTELTQASKKALPYQVYQFAIEPTNHKLLYKRIEQRFYRMLKLGFELEVKSLFSRGDLHINMPSIRCIGYRQMWLWIEGKISYDEMVHYSIRATKQLSKKQITWLRNWKGAYRIDSENLQQTFDKILPILDNIKHSLKIT